MEQVDFSLAEQVALVSWVCVACRGRRRHLPGSEQEEVARGSPSID